MHQHCLEEGNPYEDYQMPILEMNARLMNPKLMGQDTFQYSNWSISGPFKCKADHMEAETKCFPHIHEVANVMKSAGIVAKHWV